MVALSPLSAGAGFNYEVLKIDQEQINLRPFVQSKNAGKRKENS